MVNFNSNNISNTSYTNNNYQGDTKSKHKFSKIIQLFKRSSKDSRDNTILNDFILPFPTVPEEINFQILSYLNETELTRFEQVNKKCKELTRSQILQNAFPPEMAFGKKQWAIYIGDVGIEPPLPKDIYKILESGCPFWPDKKIKDTHILALVPKTINGNPLTLLILNQAFKKIKRKCQVAFQKKEIATTYNHQPITESYWILMTKNVIEGSTKKSYKKQTAFIEKFRKETNLNYEVPSVLDATIGILSHYIRSGERLFKYESGLNEIFPSGLPVTTTNCTRCQEIGPSNTQINIGDFNSKNLCIDDGRDDESLGIATLLKFF